MSSLKYLSKLGLKIPLLFAICAAVFASAPAADAAEYLVSDTGMVICGDGSLQVSYNSPGQRGGTLVIVNEGETFDPDTRTVRPTVDDDFLGDFPWHIASNRNNTLSFALSTGATVLVKVADKPHPVFPGGPDPEAD